MKTIQLILVLAIFSCTTKLKKEKPQQPNIIFLLTDDQRWDALGAMGNKIIQTPTLDKLANNGVLFTNAHVTTSICVASRASILTGQYVSRHGINSFHDTLQNKNLINSYPLLLKNKAAYKIGFIGKYGIGLGQPSEFFDYWAAEKVHQPVYENIDKNGNTVHYTDHIESKIIEFIDDLGTKGPFCLSVSFKAPHVEDGDPRQFIYANRYKDLYKDAEFDLPETASEKYYNMFPDNFKKLQLDEQIIQNEARKRWEMRFPDKEKYQESIRSYYRLITGVDDCVASMLKKLTSLGIDDNTIIIFMGDNGFYLGEHGLAGKWYPHQESIKVPFFVYDPRAPKENKGIKIDEFTFNIDVAPTILSLAGIDVPEDKQGINALSLLKDIKPVRNDFFYEHNLNIGSIPKSEALVSKQYKYIIYHELNPVFEEFYDLEKDPHEMNNLIGNPAYEDKIAEIKVRFAQLKTAAK